MQIQRPYSEAAKAMHDHPPRKPRPTPMTYSIALRVSPFPLPTGMIGWVAADLFARYLPDATRRDPLAGLACERACRPAIACSLSLATPHLRVGITILNCPFRSFTSRSDKSLSGKSLVIRQLLHTDLQVFWERMLWEVKCRWTWTTYHRCERWV